MADMTRHVKGTFDTAQGLFLSTIIRAGQNGITQKDTAERSGLHRDTVYEQAKKSKMAGYIRVKKVGRNKRYFATQKAIYAADYYAALFSLYLKNYYFQSPQLELPFQKIKPHSPNSTVTSNEQEMKMIRKFNVLSEKIGALVLYAVIKSLEAIANSKDKKDLSEREREEHIERLFNKLLFGIFPKEILSIFAATFSEVEESSNMAIVEYKKRHPGEIVRHLEFALKDPNKSIYELDKSALDKLSIAFSKLYPSYYERLEGISQGIKRG